MKALTNILLALLLIGSVLLGAIFMAIVIRDWPLDMLEKNIATAQKFAAGSVLCFILWVAIIVVRAIVRGVMRSRNEIHKIERR